MKLKILLVNSILIYLKQEKMIFLLKIHAKKNFTYHHLLKWIARIFLTINPFSEISESKILKKVKFTHAYYDKQALDHQNQLHLIQNKENILFCGSYFGYGFHEDGIRSTIEMLKNIND